MSTSVLFRGKKRSIPDAYSQIKSGVKNATAPLNGVVVIDTGVYSAGYVGGAGINGEHTKGRDSVYRLTLETYKSLCRGSLWYALFDPFFYPDGKNGDNSQAGVDYVDYVKAATTVAATKTLTWVGGGANGGTLVIDLLDEGVVGNGVKVGSTLTRGYGLTMEVGTENASKFVLKFYNGTFTGLDADGQPYDGVLEANTVPNLVTYTPEFDNISEVISWMKSDSTFGSAFKLVSSTVVGTGAVDAADLTSTMTSGIVLFAGGTETFGSQDFDDTLTTLTNSTAAYILTDLTGANATHARNVKLVAFNNTEAKYLHQIIIGGDSGSTKLTASNASVVAAKLYDDQPVSIVHGEPLVNSTYTGTNLKGFPVIYRCAEIIGRACGLPPQNGLTFKTLGEKAERYPLSTTEIELGLKYGVLMAAYNDTVGRVCVVQGINTIQDNTNVVNNAGKTHSMQAVRILNELNKSIQIAARTELLGTNDGVNSLSISDRVLVDWTSSKLKERVGTWLVSFSNVSVKRVEDSRFISYDVVINGEVTKVFFTGTYTI